MCVTTSNLYMIGLDCCELFIVHFFAIGSDFIFLYFAESLEMTFTVLCIYKGYLILNNANLSSSNTKCQ